MKLRLIMKDGKVEDYDKVELVRVIYGQIRFICGDPMNQKTVASDKVDKVGVYELD